MRPSKMSVFRLLSNLGSKTPHAIWHLAAADRVHDPVGDEARMQRNAQHVFEDCKQEDADPRSEAERQPPAHFRAIAQEQHQEYRDRKVEAEQDDAEDEGEEIATDDGFAPQLLARREALFGQQNVADIEMHLVADSARDLF